jgi:hypothetical protein
MFFQRGLIFHQGLSTKHLLKGAMNYFASSKENLLKCLDELSALSKDVKWIFQRVLIVH